MTAAFSDGMPAKTTAISVSTRPRRKQAGTSDLFSMLFFAVVWEVGAPFYIPLRSGGLYPSLLLIRKRQTNVMGCPLELTATPVASPKYRSGGSLSGPALDWKGISGPGCCAMTGELSTTSIATPFIEGCLAVKGRPPKESKARRAARALFR